MNFLAQTKVIWSSTPLPPATQQALDARIALLTSQGKTDGQFTANKTPEDHVEFTRNWVTVEDADEWIVFITTYGVMSATVVELP